MQCKKCRNMIPGDYVICPWCGTDNTPQKKAAGFCTVCGTMLQEGYIVCPKCATPIGGARPVYNPAMQREKAAFFGQFGFFCFLSLVALILAFITNNNLKVYKYILPDEYYDEYHAIGIIAIITAFFAVAISGAFWADIFVFKSGRPVAVYVFAMLANIFNVAFSIAIFIHVKNETFLITDSGDEFGKILLITLLVTAFIYIPFTIWGARTLKKIKENGGLPKKMV